MSGPSSASVLPTGLSQPRPTRDGLDAPYWEATQRHELVVQRCGSCGKHQWGPEFVCHACQSFDVGWAAVEPRGVVYSWQRVWHPVHPALADACPYVVLLVELPHADAVRMIGNLVGDPLHDVRIGDEVVAVFEDHADGDPPYTLVQWSP